MTDAPLIAILDDEPQIRRILSAALEQAGAALKSDPKLLPAHYTGFVRSDDTLYKSIRDAGLATGKLQPRP